MFDCLSRKFGETCPSRFRPLLLQQRPGRVLVRKHAAKSYRSAQQALSLKSPHSSTRGAGSRTAKTHLPAARKKLHHQQSTCFNTTQQCSATHNVLFSNRPPGVCAEAIRPSSMPRLDIQPKEPWSQRTCTARLDKLLLQQIQLQKMGRFSSRWTTWVTMKQPSAPLCC